MHDRIITRRQYPPIPPDPRFPTECPLDLTLAQLAAFWLEVQCGGRSAKRCSVAQDLPLRHAAAAYGWTTPLRSYLGRLRCQACSGVPISARLIERPDRMQPGSYGSGPGSKVLALAWPLNR